MMIFKRGFPAPGDLSPFLRSSTGGPGDMLGAGAGEVLAAAGEGLSLTGCKLAAEKYRISLS